MIISVWMMGHMALFDDVWVQNFHDGFPPELQREIHAHSIEIIEWVKKGGLQSIISHEAIVNRVLSSYKHILIPI